MARIEIFQAGCAPVKMEMPDGAYLAGVGSDCHIKLVRPDVSRHHVQLIISGERITVIDLGSSNGTVINNSSEPIFSQQPTSITSGSEIRLGRSTKSGFLPTLKPKKFRQLRCRKRNRYSKLKRRKLF